MQPSKQLYSKKKYPQTRFSIMTTLRKAFFLKKDQLIDSNELDLMNVSNNVAIKCKCPERNLIFRHYLTAVIEVRK